MLETSKLVPHIYTKSSRDFQFYLKLLDVVVNSSRLSASKITDTYNPNICSNRLLQLLASIYNYSGRYDMTDEDLRVVLDNYSFLVRNKGTKRGVAQAVSTVIKLTGNTRTAYSTDIRRFDETGNAQFVIRVSVSGKFNRRYLEELLAAVAPVGFVLEVYVASVSGKMSRVLADTIVTTNAVDVDVVSSVTPASSSIEDDDSVGTVIYRAEVTD